MMNFIWILTFVGTILLICMIYVIYLLSTDEVY